MAQSKAHMAATSRYEQKAYDKLLIRLRKDAEVNGNAVRAHAESQGESMQGFVVRAITETMARDRAETTE